MGLMYCPNPTAVCSLSQHTNLPEFQIQCPEPHLGANIHHPKTTLFNTTDNSWHLQIQLFSLPPQKKTQRKIFNWCLSSISIDSRSLPRCSPLREAPTIDIRTAILWTCNGSDHRPSKVASFWRVESNNGNVEEACMYLYIYMYCILYNAHSIKLYRTLKRLRFPLSTIESSGCS